MPAIIEYHILQSEYQKLSNRHLPDSEPLSVTIKVVAVALFAQTTQTFYSISYACSVHTLRTLKNSVLIKTYN